MFPQGASEAAVQQHVWADALAAGHLVEAACLLRTPVCAGPHLRHRRALAPLLDVKVGFPLAKLFGDEGAAADVPFILTVPGGSLWRGKSPAAAGGKR